MEKRTAADIREEINFRTGKLAGEDEGRPGIWGDLFRKNPVGTSGGRDQGKRSGPAIRTYAFPGRV